MESRERPVLYVCDPAKNTGCRKWGCVYNPDALVKTCAKTKNPAFAVLDENGEPMKAPGKTLEALLEENFKDAGLPDGQAPTEEEARAEIERFLNRVREKCEQMGKATDWINPLLAAVCTHPGNDTYCQPGPQ